MKKFTAFFVILAIMAVSLAGCAGSPEDESGVAKVKQTLVIGTDADINNLDLQKQQDQINNIVLKNTHQTLVFFTNEQTFEPGLALRWEFSEDSRKITFYLRDDVTFSDGTSMTAEDVKFTYEMALENEAGSLLEGLIEIHVTDTYVVELIVEEYHNEFVQSLASVPLGIQSKKAYESGMEEPYTIGTGPYRFVEWIEGEHCRLEKVEGYWGEIAEELPDYYAPGVSKAIEFRPYVNGEERSVALLNGDIDVCINPPINELQTLEEDSNINIIEKTGTRLFYLGFNVEAEPWQNQTLRQAAACAIDRKAVLDAAVFGKGVLQTTILNRGLWGFYDDMEGFDYDLERAKVLMAEAGYPDGDADHVVLTTTLLYATSSPYEQIATIIQSNLKKIGIEVILTKVEDALLKEECENGNQDLFLWRWNEDSKVDFVYRDLFYTDSINNYHHYSDSYADTLIDQIATEKSEQIRTNLAEELQTYLVNACPQVSLYTANFVIAFDKDLQGAYFYGGGNHYWAHAYINE